jgi:hypothetical protein
MTQLLEEATRALEEGMPELVRQVRDIIRYEMLSPEVARVTGRITGLLTDVSHAKAAAVLTSLLAELLATFPQDGPREGIGASIALLALDHAGSALACARPAGSA